MSHTNSYSTQCLDEADLVSVAAALAGDFLTQGKAVPRFEEALCEFTGARHAVAVSSGTAALHLACLAGGLGPDKSSVTSAITFVASANAPLYCGAASYLADVEPQTACISPRTLEAVLSRHNNVASVIPVHFAGLSIGAEALRATAGDRVIIEDACHSLGGVEEDGAPVGGCRHSDMAILSFHAVKAITTAEGGAITTNDDEFARQLRLLRSHGIERDRDLLEQPEDGPWYYEQQLLGFNYRMTELQAALGLSQLAKLPTFMARRRELALRYHALLSDVAHVRPLHDTEMTKRSGNHLFVVRIDFKRAGVTRAQVMERLRANNIGTQVHYIPVYRQPFHAARGVGAPADFPNSEAYYAECLSLPLHSRLDDQDVEMVVAKLVEACRP